MKMKNKKVLVGMSGGVDSSCAAFLLKKEGFEVDLFDGTQYGDGELSSPQNRARFLQARNLFSCINNSARTLNRITR